MVSARLKWGIFGTVFLLKEWARISVLAVPPTRFDFEARAPYLLPVVGLHGGGGGDAEVGEARGLGRRPLEAQGQVGRRVPAREIV